MSQTFGFRCTLCEFGKRPDGKGCTHCEDNCGSLAECDEEAGELGPVCQSSDLFYI